MARIVVAEDDPHILRVISLWLARQGHEVLEARHGQAALDRVEQDRPDLLITDINMPVMDGLQLLERIIERGSVLRGIVVLTNRWDHSEMGERLSQYGVHVLPKPFSPARLSELIQALACGNGAASDGARTDGPRPAGGQP